MNPVVMTVMLVTQNGVPIDAVHLPPQGEPEPEELDLAGGTWRSSSRTGSP